MQNFQDKTSYYNEISFRQVQLELLSLWSYIMKTRPETIMCYHQYNQDKASYKDKQKARNKKPFDRF